MSRVGRKGIDIQGVVVSIADSVVTVKGRLGELSLKVNDCVRLEQSEAVLSVVRCDDSKPTRQKHGLYRALIANMVVGVTVGFERTLELVGVGYRVAKEGRGIGFQLGFSHPVVYMPPEGVTVDIDGQTKIKVSGIDIQQVGSVVNDLLRDYRPLEPYKGKGIKLEGFVGRRKAGKSAK